MTDEKPTNVPTATRILAALRELVGALDRRIPHSDGPGEKLTAEDSQRLRPDATVRIEELTRAASAVNGYDQDLVEAIMTDDGGPEHARAMGLPCSGPTELSHQQ